MAVRVGKGIEIIGLKELQKFYNEFGKITEREIKKENKNSAMQVTRDYKRGTAKNGNINKTAVYDSDDNWLSAEAGNTRKEAVYIEYGTEAHFITPKRANFLSFFWPKLNKQVFLKWVAHPGTIANAALTMAFSKWLSGNKYAKRLTERLATIK